MQVRYQAAPRSDTIVLIEKPHAAGDSPRAVSMIRRLWKVRRSAAQHLHQLLELDPHLPDDLLALCDVGARLFSGQLVARPADGEALVVEQAPDLANDEYVLALVVAPVAAPLDRLQLGELLLPIAQHVRLDPAKLAHLSDGEVPLAWNRRQLGVILWLQHTLRPVP